jgi:protein TonB
MEAPAEVTLPLPEPKAVEKKPEENPDKQKSETTPENPGPPQINAGTRSEQKTAVMPRAPIASWLATVAAKVKAVQRYPARARARSEQGTATVKFLLSRNGSVLSRSIVRSSGHAELDQEALAMIVRAAPLPPFPPGKTEETIELKLPINFVLEP